LFLAFARNGHAATHCESGLRNIFSALKHPVRARAEAKGAAATGACALHLGASVRAAMDRFYLCMHKEIF